MIARRLERAAGREGDKEFAVGEKPKPRCPGLDEIPHGMVAFRPIL